MKREEYDNYLNLIEEALDTAKKIPRYFSKYSNRIYCNHQKLTIIILMQKFKTTYRGIVSLLRASSDMRLLLGLNKVPVHTTLIRFSKKMQRFTYRLLGIRQADTVAVDATGFTLENKSYYYRTVWNMDKKQKTKHFLKLSIAADTDKQLILTYKIRIKRSHDSIDFQSLLQPVDADYFLADKGYSSKANRKFILKKKALPVIPYKRNESLLRIQGRKKLQFNKKLYGQRAKVETIFSVIKRKYGSCIRARSYATQQVELIVKLVTYNVDRKVNYLCLLNKGCTRA
jgi:IS5 family transposase